MEDTLWYWVVRRVPRRTQVYVNFVERFCEDTSFEISIRNLSSVKKLFSEIFRNKIITWYFTYFTCNNNLWFRRLKLFLDRRGMTIDQEYKIEFRIVDRSCNFSVRLSINFT